MDIDLDKLEQAAKAAQEHGTALGCDWFTEQEASCNLDQADAAFVAAASPLVVLELIKRVRAAQVDDINVADLASQPAEPPAAAATAPESGSQQ